MADSCSLCILTTVHAVYRHAHTRVYTRGSAGEHASHESTSKRARAFALCAIRNVGVTV